MKNRDCHEPSLTSVTKHAGVRAFILVAAFLSVTAKAEGFLHNPTPVPASPMEVGFSTDRSAESLVLKTIHSAKMEIRVTAYEFTSRPIAFALIQAKRAGVDVAVIADKNQEDLPRSMIYALAQVGIPVRIDRQHAIQHEKILVVDGSTVETGSFNYTVGADTRNAENAIVVYNNPALAQIYLKEWRTHWDHSAALGGFNENAKQ